MCIEIKSYTVSMCELFIQLFGTKFRDNYMVRNLIPLLFCTLFFTITEKMKAQQSNPIHQFDRHGNLIDP